MTVSHSTVDFYNVSRTQYYLVYFFFFQAEDGIRDVAVTGVQTCALPISCASSSTTWSFSALSLSGRLMVMSATPPDRKSTRLNSSHGYISYAVFCLKKKKNPYATYPRR